MSFGEKLRQRREQKGLTQEEVAAFFGEDFSRQSVSKWERNETFPEVDKLLRLSVNLEISLDVLLADELSYYRKGEDIEAIESKYPGMAAGAKTLIHILRQSNKNV